MSSLTGVTLDEATKTHVNTQAFSSRPARHTQFPPPTGSTLNGNAPIFNPMETQQYRTPASTLNAKSTIPPQTNDPNLFSNYRNPERTKQGYSTQHDLRQSTSSTSTFDTGHNSLQSSSHPRPPIVSTKVGMRFDGGLGGISAAAPVSKHTFAPYTGSTASDLPRKQIPPDTIPREDKGGWKEIGTISSPSSRENSNLSSPFGSSTIGSDPYSTHINLKHDTKGNVSPWNRPSMMPPEVKKTQSEMNEQPETDSLRRTNEHAQIQRQRSPQEQSRNSYSWGGLNGTANNHNQRQQQPREKRISANAPKPPLVNKLKGPTEGVGAKPTRPGSSAWSSSSSWDTRPPRIPQVRNSQAPANPVNRGSPGGRSTGNWNPSTSKLDDSLSAHSSKSASANSSVITQNIGSKNSSVNRSANARKTIKGDPTQTSTSKRTNVSSKGKNKNVESHFGVKISPEFEEWCLKHINECFSSTGQDLDARALIHFLMTLDNKDEIKDYVVMYLGDDQKVQEFTDGFIRLKNFENTSAGESTFHESKRSRRKRRRKKGASS